jgi:uncharacterized damage-inducible protein DinB
VVPRIPDDLKSAFASYVSAPGRLRTTLADLDAGALNRRPAGSDWSIRDIIVHLVDTEIMRAGRFFSILAEDQPVILSFNEEQFKRRLHYLWRDPELSLSLFQQLRFALAEMLEQCDAAAWERTGIHEHHGPITLAELLRRGASHGQEHIAQVIAFREALGDPVPEHARTPSEAAAASLIRP